MPAYLNDGVDCSQFPPMATGDEPLQTEIPKGMQPFVLPKVKMTPLAGFSMPARVLHPLLIFMMNPLVSLQLTGLWGGDLWLMKR
ncbi:hypothetical protein [Snodgrassella communis]|uniref:hypothetical protein n=1 Tax=Snodgrassella communis TaxID=2946699 RepID=UPI00286C60EE|nr:hypothetical protein [Snodgrassella communis]WMY92096.1 hypothetical protein PYG29_01585 [Snodgrassella communis]